MASSQPFSCLALYTLALMQHLYFFDRLIMLRTMLIFKCSGGLQCQRAVKLSQETFLALSEPPTTTQKKNHATSTAISGRYNTNLSSSN